MGAAVGLLLIVTALSAAGPQQRDVRSFAADEYPSRLSDWGVVFVEDGRLRLGSGVTFYELAIALFSDHANKLRTVWVPPGQHVQLNDGRLVFPVGTVVSKTFFYLKDEAGSLTTTAWDGDLSGLTRDRLELLETRILVKQPDGWEAVPYRWRGDNAEFHILGDVTMLALIDDDGAEVSFPYVMPTRNECASCHVVDQSSRALVPIGLKPRHLNVAREAGETQLAAWRSAGLLSDEADVGALPRAVDWDTEDVAAKARAYLDINCGHCHNADGAADTSALWLDAGDHPAWRLGFCKPPVAAGRGTGGRRFSIVPGQPDKSILIHRVTTTEPDERMPEIGRALPHDRAIELLRDWVASIPGRCEE